MYGHVLPMLVYTQLNIDVTHVHVSTHTRVETTIRRHTHTRAHTRAHGQTKRMMQHVGRDLFEII